MKIYLAARYGRREELRIVAALLRQHGHTVISRWIDTNFTDNGGSSAAPPELRAEFATHDMNDLQESECVVNFTEPAKGGRGGRHVEFGMAIAWKKKLIVVGSHEHIFHALPEVITVQSVEELLGVL